MPSGRQTWNVITILTPLINNVYVLFNFIQMDSYSVYSRVCILLLNIMYVRFIPLVFGTRSFPWNMPYIITSLFVSSVGEHLGCLQFCILRSSGAMHIIAIWFWRTHACISVWYVPRGGIIRL